MIQGAKKAGFFATLFLRVAAYLRVTGTYAIKFWGVSLVWGGTVQGLCFCRLL